MTRFQRRLVFQILETAFVDKYKVTVKGNYFMQVTKRDDESEQAIRDKRQEERAAALRAQRGLRYIIEAVGRGAGHFYRACPCLRD